MTFKNLFISNFKRIIKVIISVCSLIIMFICICNILNYIYVNNAETEIRNIKLWKEIYSADENIDTLFVGSSHVYKDINPRLLDEINNRKNIDLSTSSQSLIGSYFAIKEAIEYNNVSYVCLEMYYGVSTGELGDFCSRASMKNNWRNIDYMRFSKNKLNYIFSACNKELLLETFIPFTRYRSKLFDLPYIESTIGNKLKSEYKNMFYERYDEDGKVFFRAEDRGYVYGERQFEENKYIIYKNAEKEMMTEDAKRWLEKIINLCEENNIKIVLFSSPIPDITLIAWGYYDEYVNDVKKIADKYKIQYYDFNLASGEYFPIQQFQYFMDDDHLNALGAELFTPFLWNVVSGEINSDDVFYDSFEEKLENSTPQIFGILKSEHENNINYEISTNYSEKYEYRIICNIEGGEQVMVQDFSDKTSFERPKEEHGLITVVVRDSTDLNSVVTREFFY